MSDTEKTTKSPLAELVTKHIKKRRIQAEQDDLQIINTEDLVVEESGDPELLPQIQQCQETPIPYIRDLKFVVRLAACRGRRNRLITMAEQTMLLSLIKQPVRLHKDLRQPIDVWQIFEHKLLEVLPHDETSFEAEWFNKNWSSVLEIVSDTLLLVI